MTPLGSSHPWAHLADIDSWALRSFLLISLVVFSAVSGLHAILHKRDPRAGLNWVVLCLLFPFIGPCLYWLLGVNRIRTQAKRMVRLGLWRHGTLVKKEDWVPRLASGHPFHEMDFRGLLNVSEKVNRHPLMIGNRVGILREGEEAYPEMLSAIDSAEQFICLSTYIFEPEGIGQDFIGSLVRAKERGVKVWVLLDAFGEHYGKGGVSKSLRRLGVEVARFLPLDLSMKSLHLNLRNHRKSLIVDGKVAFTGGMNIRPRHLRSSFGDKGISDIHFKVEGPVILELQEVFLEDWFFATGESLPWLATPHELLPGSMVCRVISGGPNEDFEKIHWLILGALAWAKSRIQIMTPYFVPDRILIAALNTAALRGVSLEIFLPERNNLPFVGWASRSLLWEMLGKGVRFFYQPPPFNHSKMFLVDESYALIGSSNWDSRSLRLNFELDLEVYDAGFGKALAMQFDQARKRSRPVTLEEVQRDPFPARLRNSICRLFSPYL